MRVTVSRESAPSWENLDAPVTVVSSAIANCFLTMKHTFSRVSGLACSKNQMVFNTISHWLQWCNVICALYMIPTKLQWDWFNPHNIQYKLWDHILPTTMSVTLHSTCLVINPCSWLNILIFLIYFLSSTIYLIAFLELHGSIIRTNSSATSNPIVWHKVWLTIS